MLQLLNHAAGPPAPPTVDRDLRRRIVPAIRALIRLGYFKFEVEGAEHLPRDGRAVYAQNHSGWFPLDAFFLGLAVGDALGDEKTPVFAAHDSAVAAPILGPFLRRAGAIPASWLRRPERLPPELRAIGIFPEGVAGNCKPFWRAYRMAPWSRGFVRAAAALDLPIVPAAVIGGEECLPVAWTVKRLEPIIGSVVGLPLSLLPLPSRWKIVFHPPVRVKAGRGALTDTSYCTDVAERIRATVQATLDAHAGHHPLARLSSLVEALERRAPAALHGLGARA